ncbi:glycosyltransferase [Paenibacillus sp. LMG 31459]|uniref:Glycosyltransferase n=1 Tax=Paenibacillus phytohabitans TaxID=2654978 RepID=A0ABX1YGF6_9BACL|nr:glycosyltransferase family 4 protein [Paenibacillus phytohabitans]NOU79236.1 glycosyltransferase [Paenibacillus phytohabitans]
MKHKRCLAVIDTKFPWMMSGFRYWENYYIKQERPDTFFFAVQPHTDPFPAKVYHLSEFENMVVKHGITDVYCVFLNLMLSLLGENVMGNEKVPGSNSLWSIRETIEKYNLQLHTTLYPGGGLDPSTPKEYIVRAGRSCRTIFTNINEVSNILPNSIFIPGMINSKFYTMQEKQSEYPIELVFCADNAIRKGFPTLVHAFNRLSDEFHLHIVGNWSKELYSLTNQNFTYHGALNPLQLRQLYKECHVFISCSTQDKFALDGFPTTAAGEAMATGCVLISTNARNDERIIENVQDYYEIEEDNPEMLYKTLNAVLDNFPAVQQMGYNAAKKIQSLLDAEMNVKMKLEFIFSDSQE